MICFVKLNPFMSSLSISQLNPRFLHKTRKWFQRMKLVVNIIFCRIARIEQFLSKFERFKIGVSENTKELAVGCIVVTGANRGIGLELCRQFRPQSELLPFAVVILRSWLLELNTQVSICRLRGAEIDCRAWPFVPGRTLDMLINNADLA